MKIEKVRSRGLMKLLDTSWIKQDEGQKNEKQT